MSAKELNIGDYVRFDYHRVTVPILIGKIVHIEYDKAEKHCFYVTDGGLVIGNENIIESSPNIIDLIELRDIVELFEEDDVDGELTGFYEVLAYTTDRKEIGVRNKDGEIDFYPAENLRGIITYEQIASMEYKIGE